MRPCAGNRVQRATAAPAVRQQLHLVLLSCLVASVRCAFTGVTLSGRDFGCFPTTFSANPSPTIAASPVLILPSDGCTEDQYDASVAPGSTVIALLHDEAKAEGCTVSTRGPRQKLVPSASFCATMCLERSRTCSLGQRRTSSRTCRIEQRAPLALKCSHAWSVTKMGTPSCSLQQPRLAMRC